MPLRWVTPDAIADGDAHCGCKCQQEGKEDRHRDGNWLEEELVKTD